mgnify:CR=1 FL=1
MKRSIALLFSMIFILSACSIDKNPGSTQSPGLAFSLSLDQDTHNVGEEILAVWELENLSEEAILVNRRLSPNAIPEFSEIDFIFVAPLARGIHLVVDIEMRNLPEEDDFILLDPGQIVSGYYLISRVYGPLTDPGEYSIRAIYNNHFNPPSGTPAWQDEIYSNMVLFTIIP